MIPIRPQFSNCAVGGEDRFVERLTSLVFIVLQKALYNTAIVLLDRPDIVVVD